MRRVPEVGSGDFRLGSQVIVRESQRAVFYRDGHSLDVFPPGRHTISTMNLPLLSGLLKLATALLAAVGSISVAITFRNGGLLNGASTLFLGGLLAYQFGAGLLASRD